MSPAQLEIHRDELRAKVTSEALRLRVLFAMCDYCGKPYGQEHHDYVSGIGYELCRNGSAGR